MRPQNSCIHRVDFLLLNVVVILIVFYVSRITLYCYVPVPLEMATMAAHQAVLYKYHLL